MDGNQWHEFTVNTNKSVQVIVNPNGTTPVAELTLANAASQRNICPAENNEERTRGNNEVFWISGCMAGSGTIELCDSATNELVVSYPVIVVGSPSVSPPAGGN